MSAPLRVGIIGTGFGVSAQVPGFRSAPGVQIAAICSSRQERADAAAREHGIPLAYADYRAMLAEAALDLVSIVTPPALHAPMTLAALKASCHVLCEKPFALDVAEAQTMLAAAEASGRLHVVDHELRFNPNRQRIAALLRAGYIGAPRYVNIRSVSGLRADPGRHWDWWSQRAQGGGALGANGSHQIDMVRWWLGEVTAVSGQLNTFVTERPDLSGAPQPVDSDDHVAFTLRCASGAQAHVLISYVAHLGGSNQIELHGEWGSLLLDHDERLWGMQLGGAREELTVPDPLAGTAELPASIWGLGFARLAQELAAAIGAKRPPQGCATFADGLRVQQVLDAIRQSDRERRWVTIEGGT